MRKLSHKEVIRIFASGHRVSKWQSWDVNQSKPNSRDHAFNHHGSSLCPVYFISFCLTIIYEMPNLGNTEKRGTLLLTLAFKGSEEQVQLCITYWGVLSALKHIWFFLDERRRAQMLGRMMTHFIRWAKLLKYLSIRRPFIWVVGSEKYNP